MLTLFLNAYSCPLTITNDTDHLVLIVDPKGPEAVLIPEKTTVTIDPTITNFVMKYISNEKLDIYYTVEGSSNLFYKKYRLTEKYCTDNVEDNKLTLSQILEFVDHPTKRFQMKEIQKTEKPMEHTH